MVIDLFAIPQVLYEVRGVDYSTNPYSMAKILRHR